MHYMYCPTTYGEMKVLVNLTCNQMYKYFCKRIMCCFVLGKMQLLWY